MTDLDGTRTRVDDALAAPESVTSLSLIGPEAVRADEAIRACPDLREVFLDHPTIALEALGESGVTRLRVTGAKHLRVAAWPETLEALALVDCTGVELPPLTALPRLKELEVDRSSVDLGLLLAPGLRRLVFTRGTLDALPAHLFALEQLKHLDLSGNALGELAIPEGAWPSLGVLLLADNQLTALPDPLGKLPKLRELSIAKNRVARLPDTTMELAKLETLVIESNPGIENVLPVVTALAKHNLRRVYAKGARLPRADVQALGRMKRPTLYR
ncbi:MAG: hypothetical protein KC619_04575 [Myxococcales bacterium]|nr:hypothetical protein [Myxococcales bacterium]